MKLAENNRKLVAADNNVITIAADFDPPCKETYQGLETKARKHCAPAKLANSVRVEFTDS
jgi:hypothetical protein